MHSAVLWDCRYRLLDRTGSGIGHCWTNGFEWLCKRSEAFGINGNNSSKYLRNPNIDRPWTCVCVCVSFVCISFVSVTKCWEMGYSLICGCQCVCFKFQRSPLCWWWATRAKIQLQSVTKTSQALTLSRECFNAAYCGIGVVLKRIITYFYFCISSFLRRNNWMNRPKLATTNQPWSFL